LSHAIDLPLKKRTNRDDDGRQRHAMHRMMAAARGLPSALYGAPLGVRRAYRHGMLARS
jgi:hypothetical protein